MKEANLNFSEEQIAVVANTSFILTKHEVIQKIIEFMGELSERYKELVINYRTPAAFIAAHPKISKGEQYELLPYVILDYPRLFNKKHVLAIRSFFWWGNYFSLTLHVSGSFVTQVQNVIAANKILFDDWLWSNSEDEWQHNINPKDYVLCKTLSTDDIQQPRNFIKLAKYLPLIQYNMAANFFTENYKSLLKIVSSINFPNDEITL